MRCRVCGGNLRPAVTDLPFKTGEHTIVIIKGLPVSQCEQCSEYVMDDPTFERVETMLSRVERGTELEIVSFAA